MTMNTFLLLAFILTSASSFGLPNHHFLHLTKSATLLQQRNVVATVTAFPKSLLVSTDNVAVLPAADGSPPFTILSDENSNIQAIAAKTDVLGVIQNVALGVTAVLFLLAGLTYLTASVLIPAGAQQLETECLAILPDTWQDYQQKLEEGQTMKDRPDLMFELGLLLNKAKADQLETMCQQTDNMDLWNKYQQKLENGQGLQDRPELIQQLSMEMGERATDKIKNKCPPALWQQYESQLKPGETMAMRQDLLMALTQEPEYLQLFDAAKTSMEENVSNTVIDVTPTDNKSQWDE